MTVSDQHEIITEFCLCLLYDLNDADARRYDEWARFRQAYSSRFNELDNVVRSIRDNFDIDILVRKTCACYLRECIQKRIPPGESYNPELFKNVMNYYEADCGKYKLAFPEELRYVSRIISLQLEEFQNITLQFTDYTSHELQEAKDEVIMRSSHSISLLRKDVVNAKADIKKQTDSATKALNQKINGAKKLFPSTLPMQRKSLLKSV